MTKRVDGPADVDGCNQRPRPRVVAVIPALDEAPAIGQVVDALVKQTYVRFTRVIVVDNGSRDGTAEIARQAGASVVREGRRGYGYACRAGVTAAHDADIIVLLDGDAADDPHDLPRLLQPLLSGAADLVVGSRALSAPDAGALTRPQVLGNRLAAWLMGVIYGARVTDLGPLRAIRRRDLLALEPVMHFFAIEATDW